MRTVGRMPGEMKEWKVRNARCGRKWEGMGRDAEGSVGRPTIRMAFMVGENGWDNLAGIVERRWLKLLRYR